MKKILSARYAGAFVALAYPALADDTSDAAKKAVKSLAGRGARGR